VCVAGRDKVQYFSTPITGRYGEENLRKKERKKGRKEERKKGRKERKEEERKKERKT
jgi:hypothetical protein